MTHLKNIERNFTFTRKRTDNEERNEIGVSLSDSNKELGDMPYSTETWLIIDTIPKNFAHLLPSTLKNIISLQSRRNFGERVLSNFLTKIMAAIFDF